MAQVRELFSELFAYVLLFDQTTLHGEFQPPYEQVRRDIAGLLEQKAGAKRQGISEKDYHEACFAVVAWADEMILKHTTWKHHHQWNAYPLQQEYYQTRDAGHDFFTRLEQLRSEQQEIREVYYFCLGLGFSGQYWQGPEDERKLNEIRHEQARHLPLPIKELRNLDKITPQPYEVPTPTPRPPPYLLTPLLLKAGLALLALVPLALLLSYWIWSVDRGPTGPSAKKIQEWLDTHRDLLPCAKISLTSVDEQTGVVHLRGRVASQAQSAEVREGVRKLEGVSQVNDTFQTIPRPFCDVLDLLEPLQQRDVMATLNKQGGPPVYHEGENLVIDVKTPAKFDSYVYVDYYATDGMVGHLFPNRMERGQVFKPNSVYAVGKPGDPQRMEWKMGPPFGVDLVTVIVSKGPLFSMPRDDVERAEAYLTELRRILPKSAKAEIDATFHFVTIRQAGQ
jgi:type IV/VI secretion system ImpK/VasF family protein